MIKSASNLLSNVFGSRNQRLLRTYGKFITQGNTWEPELQNLDDEALKAKTTEFKTRLEEHGDLNSLLSEAFAVVREASVRTLGMRHFDVQLVGGVALHQGKIAEMRTGEGKTLVATLAAYLNALPGKGVHIVTVNDYLAQRDALWMGPIYEFLGLTVGVVKAGQSQDEKKAAYAADITYGTNNEFGFDYLRDNLSFRLEDRVQRDLAFAIVDEVDSILIDEARTPLIISGRSEESTELYGQINRLIPSLKPHKPPAGKVNEDIEAARVVVKSVSGEELGEMPIEEALARRGTHHLIEVEPDAKPSRCQFIEPGDYLVDEKSKQAHLTEEGQDKVEPLLVKAGILVDGDSLYDTGNIRLMHHLNAALRAHALFNKEVEYIVKDGEVVIVDEFTGRTMPGRRWSDGLHQAIEAKEGVRVKEENQTVASITFQNYFRLYGKLAGMTGTADTEAYEFQQIYNLEVVVIPTHKEMIRDDAPDLVYLTQEDKFKAIIEDIEDCHQRGQPVLVGTTSIETSELLSGFLKKEKIAHQVLNAKYHEQEAEIIAQAGSPGTVTIATNMAGRGTDIVLTQKSIDNGGLAVIYTFYPANYRVEMQGFGRAGRQGRRCACGAAAHRPRKQFQWHPLAGVAERRPNRDGRADDTANQAQNQQPTVLGQHPPVGDRGLALFRGDHPPALFRAADLGQRQFDRAFAIGRHARQYPEIALLDQAFLERLGKALERLGVARQQQAAAGIGIDPVHGHGRALETQLQFLEMVLERGPAAAGAFDRQPGRLVDDERFAVFEQDGDMGHRAFRSPRACRRAVGGGMRRPWRKTRRATSGRRAGVIPRPAAHPSSAAAHCRA